MEENLTTGPVSNKNNKWLWILGAIGAIAVLAYFIFTNLNSFNLTTGGGSQNTQAGQQNNNQTAINTAEENVDSLLNQLDAAEGDVTQALSDTPIDVMSDK